MPESESKRGPVGARAVVRAWWPMAGGLALFFAAATYGRADADLWGHLRYGLDALRDRGLTSVDPYSFTQDVPWVNHEWLSEVQTAIAYQLGGVPIVLHLLSPADREIQITSDLPGFWSGTWADVRKDLAGRYPKHRWPDDPTTEPPRRLKGR